MERVQEFTPTREKLYVFAQSRALELVARQERARVRVSSWLARSERATRDKEKRSPVQFLMQTLTRTGSRQETGDTFRFFPLSSSGKKINSKISLARDANRKAKIWLRAKSMSGYNCRI